MTLTKEQAELRATDTSYEEAPIKEVGRYRGSYSLTLANSTGFGFKASYLKGKRPPQVGDIARVYAKWGSTIRGVDLRGEPLFYKTQAELDAEHAEWVADHKERKRKRFKKDRRKLDRQFASLPDVFQRRISWFRAWNPDFRVDNEAYEMMVCLDAVKIAQACGTEAKVRQFSKRSWAKQHELVPDLEEGHSGNSFGAAVNLARLYLHDPILVMAEHGALTPLVGCEDFGCAHPRPQDVLDAVAALAAKDEKAA